MLLVSNERYSLTLILFWEEWSQLQLLLKHCPLLSLSLSVLSILQCPDAKYRDVFLTGRDINYLHSPLLAAISFLTDFFKARDDVNIFQVTLLNIPSSWY